MRCKYIQINLSKMERILICVINMQDVLLDAYKFGI
jgi:hypothetical protein